MLTNKLMGASGPEKQFIEDLFAVHLYTGNGSTQTINNGIDLAGKGGMVWFKNRGRAELSAVFDTTRGTSAFLTTSSTAGQTTDNNAITFNSNGFSLNKISDLYNNSYLDQIFASWTFRKAPKFFDVVTYTGNGAARTISHSLGSVPGMIIVKCTSTTGNWAVYHNGQTSASYYTKLNLTDAQASDTTVWNGTTPTSSVFSVGTSALTNTNGATYVAYLFAHDTTTDGLIQCGSFTGVTNVNLGWEPQYLLYKRTDSTSDWGIVDTMRGWSVNSPDNFLAANTATAEDTSANRYNPTSTGFYMGLSGTYIYMAIRRGPMRTPTDGTKVFSPTTNVTSVTTNFPVDSYWLGLKSGGGTFTRNRLTGGAPYLQTNSTAVEGEGADVGFDSNTGLKYTASTDYINWNFRRAPGFFDVVCYTGTGVDRSVNHNLGVAPELVIIKNRSDGTSGQVDANWFVSAPNLLSSGYCLFLNSDLGIYNWTVQNYSNFAFTASTLSITGGQQQLNRTSNNYVAYLFASCPGVSKVGSYTGNGSSQTINCGFTNGARFVLIKRTTGGVWYVWDTARGIVAGNDPHLSLNSTAAEVTTDDTIDPDSTGFIVNQVAATNVNVSGGSYIFLAIA